MTDSPLTPPTRDRPSADQPIDPPVPHLAAAEVPLRAATQRIYDQVHGLREAAMIAYDGAAQQLRGQIRGDLAGAQALYDRAAQQLSDSAYGALSGAAGQLPYAVASSITPGELAQLAATTPLAWSPPPQLPPPPPSYVPAPAGRVTSAYPTGLMIGVPELPPAPAPPPGFWAPPVWTTPAVPTPPAPSATTTQPVPTPIPPQPIAVPVPIAVPLPPVYVPGQPYGVPVPTPVPVAVPYPQPFPYPQPQPTTTQPTTTPAPCPPPNVNVACPPAGPVTVNVAAPPPVIVPAPQVTVQMPPAPGLGGGTTIQVMPCQPQAPYVLNNPTIVVQNHPAQPATIQPQFTFSPNIEVACPPPGQVAITTVTPTQPGDDPPDKPDEPEEPPAWTLDDIDIKGVQDFLNVFTSWMEANATVMSDVVTVEGCERVKTAGAGVAAAMQLFWKAITGDIHGKSWNKKQGLPFIIDSMPVIGQYLFEPLGQLFAFGLKLWVQNISTLTGCTNPAGIPLILLRAVVGAAETWAGTPLPEAHARLDQVIGQLCPTGIPSVQEAHVARMTGEWSKPFWECVVRANGAREDLAEDIYNAQTIRPSAFQAVQYWNMAGGNAAGLEAIFNRIGVRGPYFQDMFEMLGRFFPGASDIVSFMTRDVFDANVSAKYGYDEDFEKKYAGKALEWGRANGMTPDVFRYYWRAHWHLPSPTQGYEMIHRLRPGRVGAALVTTRKTIDELLQVNDYPKFWRDRLVEISYHPLTRVDTRRAYFMGALSEDETFAAVLDLGYNERDAGLLLRYWNRERQQWLKRQPVYKEALSGAIGKQEFVETLQYQGMAHADALAMHRHVISDMQKQSSAAAFAAIKRRVVTGFLGRIEAANELVGMGHDIESANAITRGWDAERSGRGKHATAAQLCKFYDRGLIEADEFVSGLLAQGYTAKTAGNVIKVCSGDNDERAAKKGAASELAKQRTKEKEERREAKEQKLRDGKTTYAARQSQRDRAAEARVQRRILASADDLVGAFGGAVNDYHGPLETLLDAITARTGFSRDSGAMLLAEAVKEHASRRRDDWKDRVEVWVDLLPGKGE